MTCWVIIPVKAPADAKRRLEPALTPGERAELVRTMLAQVVNAASSATGVANVCLVGPSRYDCPDDIILLVDPGGGLNPALGAALKVVPASVSRVVMLAGDLPHVTREEVERLASGAPSELLIAPDRHGTGTNALSLPLPQARAFGFAYGEGSAKRHKAEAARLGLACREFRSPGLERDIDTPEDLETFRLIYAGSN